MIKKVIFVFLIVCSSKVYAVSPLAECMIIVKQFALTEIGRCSENYGGAGVLPGISGVFKGALKAHCIAKVERMAKELEDLCNDTFGGGPTIEPETPGQSLFSKNPPPKVKLEIKKIDRNLERSFQKGKQAIDDLR